MGAGWTKIRDSGERKERGGVSDRFRKGRFCTKARLGGGEKFSPFALECPEGGDIEIRRKEGIFKKGEEEEEEQNSGEKKGKDDRQLESEFPSQSQLYELQDASKSGKSLQIKGKRKGIDQSSH